MVAIYLRLMDRYISIGFEVPISDEPANRHCLSAFFETQESVGALPLRPLRTQLEFQIHAVQ
jgi:hypothetical protein